MSNAKQRTDFEWMQKNALMVLRRSRKRNGLVIKRSRERNIYVEAIPVPETKRMLLTFEVNPSEPELLDSLKEWSKELPFFRRTILRKEVCLLYVEFNQ